MLTKYLALVSESSIVNFSEVSIIAATLQKQITRDFVPIWETKATISAFASLEEIPSDYWRIIIKDDIGYNVAGIHLDYNRQPYALVDAQSKSLSIICSHEALEMLADPFGDRLVAGRSIMPGQGRVEYLVEICDPVVHDKFAYTVNGVRVSDFYTPHFFDPITSPSVRYSFTGAIRKPLQILDGGYLSWMIPETGEWWQAIHAHGSLEFNSRGFVAGGAKSFREIIDSKTNEALATLNKKPKKSKRKALEETLVTNSVSTASLGSAKKLREDISLLLENHKNK